MKSAIITCICLALALIVWPYHVWAENDHVCSVAQEEWAPAFAKVKEKVQTLADFKAKSVAPQIESRLGQNKSGVSVAAVVRQVLAERNQELERIKAECEAVTATEREAYEKLRACRTADRKSRSEKAFKRDPIIKERLAKVAELDELLVNEAYAQYKKEEVVPTAVASGVNNQRNAYEQDNAPYSQYYQWR